MSNRKHTFGEWMIAVRPWSFPASAMPIIATLAFLFWTEAQINWIHGILTLVGMILFHIAGNTWSDYFDFKKKVDAEDTFGAKTLTTGMFEPKEIKNLASVFGALKTEVLPQLRRAQIVNSIDLTGKTDAEMVALINAGNASELNLEELLHIAEVQPAVAEVALKAAVNKYGDARAYNNLAIVLAKQGDYAGALKALDSAAKAGSKSAELNNNYALVYLAMGETNKAAVYAQGANAEVQALAAAAQGDYATASKNLEGYNAAIVQVQEGNLAAAKNSIANDESAKADYLRAVIAAKEGNVEAAKAALQTAISKDASLAKKAAKDVNLAALR